MTRFESGCGSTLNLLCSLFRLALFTVSRWTSNFDAFHANLTKPTSEEREKWSSENLNEGDKPTNLTEQLPSSFRVMPETFVLMMNGEITQELTSLQIHELPKSFQSIEFQVLSPNLSVHFD